MFQYLFSLMVVPIMLLSYEIRLDSPSIKQDSVQEKKRYHLVRDDAKEIVIDENTGLMWQDNIDTKTIRKNREDAKQYCRDLVFAGYNDWYLPREKELKTIVDIKNNPTIKEGFKNIVANHYWSASPNLSDTDNVINVDFKSGNSYYTNRRGKTYVRCTRGRYKIL